MAANYLGDAGDKAGAGALIAGSYALLTGSWVAFGVSFLASGLWALWFLTSRKGELQNLRMELSKLQATVEEEREKLTKVRNTMALDKRR